jgi:hypothetical protein
MTPHPLSQLEAFPAAAHAFSQVLIWAQQQAPLRASLSGFESSANEHLRELGRLLVQGFFDACFEAELAAKQGKRRVSGRLIECVFGEVVERRLSEATDEGPARFPLDAQLNVPPERYSLGVRQRVAHAATSQPLGAVVLALKADGMQVPKRQAQQLAERAALDVEAFQSTRARATTPIKRTCCWSARTTPRAFWFARRRCVRTPRKRRSWRARSPRATRRRRPGCSDIVTAWRV